MRLSQKIALVTAFLAIAHTWTYVFANDDTNSGRESRNFTFSYSFKVQGIPDTAHNLEIWAPLPQSDPSQQVRDLRIYAPIRYTVESDSEYGNQILHLRLQDALPSEIEVKVEFTVVRRERSLRGRLGEFCKVDRESLKRYLAPDKLVPIDGKIRQEAKEVIKEQMTTIEKAQALYDHCVATLKYDKSGTGWGRGDAIYACDVRKGNCTDINSLFIGMARSIGIPARFQIGFPIPSDKSEGEIPGYHCWAEFFDEKYGWVPLDASDAIKDPERKKCLFGNLDPDRVMFTTGRDIRIESNKEPIIFNYLIYPYVLLDGKPYDNIGKRFYFTSQS